MLRKQTKREKARQKENESKRDRESVHEKARKWLDGTSDGKCTLEKARQIERACMRRRRSDGWDNI
jgi:hypothetical protein